MLHINGLTYRIGGRILIDEATVAIPAGHKAGLVGRNGVGKTTLLRLIIGELAARGAADRRAAPRRDRHASRRKRRAGRKA